MANMDSQLKKSLELKEICEDESEIENACKQSYYWLGIVSYSFKFKIKLTHLSCDIMIISLRELAVKIKIKSTHLLMSGDMMIISLR